MHHLCKQLPERMRARRGDNESVLAGTLPISTHEYKLSNKSAYRGGIRKQSLARDIRNTRGTMKARLPMIHTVKVPSVQGIPFPDEQFEPIGVGDPQELRDRLGAQRIARTVLPFIDTRAAHWRYYLFAVPPSGRGRRLEPKHRLWRVLKETEGSRSGIGRREYPSIVDGRRSKARFLDRIKRSFGTAYGSATRAFWGANDTSSGSPSAALHNATRRYVHTGNYENFFTNDGPPDRLRHVFGARLIHLRPQLATHIIQNKYRLATAAMNAASSRKLDDSERLLFFSWALLHAYFGIADDGKLDDPEDESEDALEESKAINEDFRVLAKASLKLLDKLGTPGELNSRQVDLIRTRLKTALRHKGIYQPPVIVWKLKSDGRRRRVFASLRLYTYARLLHATKGAS